LSAGTADTPPYEERRDREAALVSAGLVRLQSQLRMLPSTKVPAAALSARRRREQAKTSPHGPSVSQRGPGLQTTPRNRLWRLPKTESRRFVWRLRANIWAQSNRSPRRAKRLKSVKFGNQADPMGLRWLVNERCEPLHLTGFGVELSSSDFWSGNQLLSY